MSENDPTDTDDSKHLLDTSILEGNNETDDVARDDRVLFYRIEIPMPDHIIRLNKSRSGYPRALLYALLAELVPAGFPASTEGRDPRTRTLELADQAIEGLLKSEAEEHQKELDHKRSFIYEILDKIEKKDKQYFVNKIDIFEAETKRIQDPDFIQHWRKMTEIYRSIVANYFP
jgi:hypothetical protein